MYQYNYYAYDQELYHWGIKGMKWGVRRFRNKDDSLTPAGKKRYDYYDEKSRNGAKSSNVKTAAKKNSNVKTATKTSSSKATDNNITDDEAAVRKAKIKKYVKVGAAVAGTALAAYGAYKVYDLYTGRKQAIDPTTGFRLLKNKNMTSMEHVNNINPGRIKLFGLGSTKNKEIINGSSYNCMLCTTAYDLRKRGFDVRAGLSKDGYMPDALFSKIYKNYNGTTKIPHPGMSIYDTKDSSTRLLDNITDSILKQGDSGSRGNIVVWWKHGGGHSMIWENDGGKIKFMDGQTGQEYKNFAQEILRHASLDKSVEVLRTDNLDINISEMKSVINNDTVFKTYVDHGAEIAVKLATDARVQIAAAGGTYAAVQGYEAYTHSPTYAKNKAKKARGGRG